jgi:hypothetical protein
VTAVGSGRTWQEDPDGNKLTAGGRTSRVWVRDVDEHSIRAMIKQPPERMPQEIYAIGMERVAFTLGAALQLPIPKVWLEDWEGAPCAVIEHILNTRTWQMAGGAPMLMSNVVNDDTWALSVLFDIWMANGDRVPRNILVEPLPEGTRAAVATESRTWLIDHGHCALWFPSKFKVGGRGADDPARHDLRVAAG